MPDFPSTAAVKPGPRRGKPRSMGKPKEKGKGKPRKSREGIQTDPKVKNAKLVDLVMPVRAAAAAKINYREDDEEVSESHLSSANNAF